MVPGTIVFLVISPWLIFLAARRLSAGLNLDSPHQLESALALLALAIGLVLMVWSLVVLWRDGKGTPAPIAPTRKLVTTGPYRLCRNPVELGTDLYIFAVGTWFDSLSTGLFCLLFAFLLGSLYIRLIEEQELKARFGNDYLRYRQRTPFMLPLPGKPRSS